MIEYRLENGKLIKVRPENEQRFLEKHPNATPVSGNQESPAEGAPIGQESAVPNQEASQSQNNTDSNLEVGSLESQKELSWSEGLAEFAKSFADPDEWSQAYDFISEVPGNIINSTEAALESVNNAMMDANKRIGETTGMFEALEGLHGYDKGSTSKLVDKEIVKSYKNIDEIKSKRGDTGKGFIKGLKGEGFADVIGATLSFIAGTIETVVPAMLTRGASLFPQIVAPMYTEYNATKAKALYGDNEEAIEKLIENDELEIMIPLALGTAAVGLEKVGLKGITTYAFGKKTASTLATSLLGTMSTEGATEWAQSGIEKFSSSTAEQKDIKQASAEAWDHLLSEEGAEAFLSGFIGAGGSGVGGRAINRAFTNDSESLNILNNLSNEISSLNEKKQLTKNEVARKAIQTRVDDLSSKLKTYVENNRGLKNYITEDQRSSLISLMENKDGLTSQVSDLQKELEAGRITKKEFDDSTKGLSAKIESIDTNIFDIKQEAVKVQSAKLVEKVKAKISDLGLDGSIEELNSEEIEALDLGFEKDENGNNVLDKDGNKVSNSKSISTEYGAIIQKPGGKGFRIIINKDKPAIGTAAHEFLHVVLQKTLGENQGIAAKIANALNEHVDSLKGDQSVMRARLDGAYDGSEFYNEETITVMSESILDGTLKFDDGFFTKVGDLVRQFLQEKGFKEVRLDTGKDVYNFIKDFNKSVKSDKFNKAFADVTKDGAKGKLVDGSKAEAKANAKPRSKPDADVKFSREDVKPEVDELGNMGWTKGTWKSQGADLAIAEMQANKMLDGLIAAKMKGGLRDGDNETKKDFISKVYSELTAHVKNFNPESNDSLFGWVNSQVSNKAGNVYNREYKDKSLERAVDIDATTSEGAPLVQIEADTDILMQRIDEIGLDETEVEQRSRLRRAIRLDESMMQTVRNAVIKTFGTKLPNVESKKFRAVLEKAFRTELKKPLQDLMGGRSEYDLFLRNHIKAIVKALPVGTLVQMERNLKPEQRIFTESRRITKSTEVDKLVSEGKLPKDTSRTSGPQLHTKKTFPGIEKVMAYFRGKDMEAILGYKVGASTLGTRKDKLAMELGVELAFDATAETIQNPEVADKRKMILELQGVEQLENELAVISKQIDRDPRVKFSKSALGIDRSKILDFKSKFPDLLNKIKSDEALATDLPSLRKVIKEVYSDILDTKEIAAVAKKIAGYTSSFLDQKKKTKGLMDVDTSLSEFVLEATEKDVIDKSVMKFLSSLLPSGYNTAASYFNDKARVKKARATFASFVTHLRDELKLPEDKILRILHTQYKGMYASSSKIGDGRFNVELIDGIYELVDKGSEAGSTHRGQVFENVDDFYRLAGVDNYKAKLKEIDTKTFAEKSKAAVKDKNYEGRLKQAKEAREAVQMIMEYYIGSIKDVDSALDYGDLLMLAKMLGSNMNSPMKRAANLAYIAEGVESMDPDSMGKLTEYEHMVPTSVKILEMVAAYVNNGKLPDGFWDNYEVAVIPKSMDKVLIKNGLRDFLPVMFKKGDENWRRYYNKQTLGEDNMVPLVSIKTGEVGKIIGADFVKASNLLVSGNINNKGAQLIGRTSIKYSKTKGMSTFDFDETLIIDGDNSIIATDPVTGQVVKISSSDWPIKGPDLAASGFEFDFSDFANVRGGKEGPLLQKMKNQIVKYGNKNVFVLTARQQASALPIQRWLKSKGIDLSIENITGLGKSEGSAKGEWMLQKFAEGYNDMYFVDDAMSNVKAVKDVLDVLDIKSKVVQAKIKFSKNASIDFNKMLEKSKGIRADAEVSSAAAKIRGAKKGRFDFFVPPSAEDFKGLIYSFLGKGKQGEADLLWFKDNLFDPFARGIREMDSIKQTMTEEYKAIKKSFPTTIKGLNEKIAGTDFTLDNAIRVYLWKEAGFEIPGLSEKEANTLWSAVKADGANEAFAEALSAISRSVDGYTKPSEFWVAETIASDLSNIVNKVNREQYLSEWIENKNIVFSKENLNKIESIYGTNFREALENILFRMESGSNRPSGQDKVVNRFINWINGSVGAVMFFNTRSAVLQTLSIANFINFKENNIFAAAKGFANQKQFWSDFAMIYNSDMLKQRRAGLKIDVSASELTEAFSKGKSRPEAIIAYLLQIGFTPTQIADSFAISMGGSTYYRNMLNKYMKDGMSKADAEAKAFLDFQEIAEETQQSSRPDMISQQQSGTLGRIILAWANTPMQMTRLTKKALSDLVNGRGDIKSNVSKILYYGMIQNFIFGSLQTGLAFLAFGDEEDEEKTQTKEIRVANGMLDTLLRGTGVYGAAVSTVKNVVLKWSEENSKGYGKRDWSRVVQEIINLSPPIGTKVRKIMSAVKTYAYNKDVIKKMGPGINNPGWSVFGNVVEAVTNAPVARVINKANNVKQILTGNMDMWQRVAILLGWSTWSVGVEDQELVDAKAEVKADRKAASKERSKQKKTDSKKSKTNIKTVRCSGTRSSGGRCNIQVETNAKSAKCMYHKEFKEGSDTDGDGKKEYRCKSKTGSGKRCRNKTENKNKRCYAHQ